MTHKSAEAYQGYLKRHTCCDFVYVSPRFKARGPERDFVDDFLLTGLSILSQRNRIKYPCGLLIEPSTSFNYPDIVYVEFESNVTIQEVGSCSLTSRDAQILHRIYNNNFENDFICFEFISSNIEAINKLSHLGFLRRKNYNGNNIQYLVPRCGFGIRKIIAIEAKLASYKYAFRQGSGNTWFASESYVLIPNKYKSHAEPINYFENVGIIMETDGYHITSVARKQGIPISIGSWLIRGHFQISCE
jgi:hypothetical protein